MNKKLLAIAVSGALALPMAAHAVKFKTSGQVNRAVMFGDDGEGSDTLHVDGDASGSRFRFVGSEDLGNGMKVGFTMELETQSEDSFSVALKQTEDAGFKFGERHINLWFSGNWGKVTMGQASDAFDGVAFADLNNAWIPVENASDYGGSIEFRGAGQSFTGITAGDVTPSYDGSRRDVFRYDTPALGPFKAMASVANNNRWDAQVRLGGSVGGGDYDVRAGFSDQDHAEGQEQWTVSGAFKFSQGTSIALAYGEADVEGPGAPDGSYFYAKLGHDWGNNSVAIDYKDSDDTAIDATCTGGACGGETFGIGFVHTLPKPKVDLYVGYRNFELDDLPGAQDIDVFFLGSRVKFD